MPDTFQLSPVPSRLDYLVAHAPAEPQPWFKPVMSTPRPADPKPQMGGKVQTRLERSIHNDERPIETFDLEPEEQQQLTEWYELNGRVIRQQGEWDQECQAERLLQWPWAWARAVLNRENAYLMLDPAGACPSCGETDRTEVQGAMVCQKCGYVDSDEDPEEVG
jgi:predicted Zn-ribbon and HTH transcriptional regulator